MILSPPKTAEIKEGLDFEGPVNNSLVQDSISLIQQSKTIVDLSYTNFLDSVENLKKDVSDIKNQLGLFQSTSNEGVSIFEAEKQWKAKLETELEKKFLYTFDRLSKVERNYNEQQRDLKEIPSMFLSIHTNVKKEMDSMNLWTYKFKEEIITWQKKIENKMDAKLFDLSQKSAANEELKKQLVDVKSVNKNGLKSLKEQITNLEQKLADQQKENQKKLKDMSLKFEQRLAEQEQAYEQKLQNILLKKVE
ncbi:hypothetical protein [Alphaproteobacteria bacterium endosymbiont of Tiliacea citrago]|uniref:hypothetical protein n=1 Tax=Alphaproteobacteria bacterium endosymbiont of Tiliacea citrago TaxID=3077944 RepID=UPI00313D1633